MFFEDDATWGSEIGLECGGPERMETRSRKPKILDVGKRVAAVENEEVDVECSEWWAGCGGERLKVMPNT